VLQFTNGRHTGQGMAAILIDGASPDACRVYLQGLSGASAAADGKKPGLANRRRFATVDGAACIGKWGRPRDLALRGLLSLGFCEPCQPGPPPNSQLPNERYGWQGLFVQYPHVWPSI
jgi:hypothetical protein